MSEAQKKHNAAGERLCRNCAVEREKTVRQGNAETANRKRKAEADAKRLELELTCAACSEKFPRQGHISSAQEADH